MRARRPAPALAWRAVAALAIAALTGRARAEAPAATTPACVLYGADDEANLAGATARHLSVPVLLLDVREESQRARVRTACAGPVLTLGAAALRAAGATPDTARILAALAPASEPAPPGRAVARVLSDVDPARSFAVLRQLAPGARRIGAVYDPRKTGALVEAARRAAAAQGLTLQALPATDVGGAIRAFHRFEKELAIDALWLLPDGTTTVQETVYYALELAHWRRIALVGLSHWYVANGALFALVPAGPRGGRDGGALARRLGQIGQQLAQGAALPEIVFNEDHALLINARAVARLGLRIPEALARDAQVLQP